MNETTSIASYWTASCRSTLGWRRSGWGWPAPKSRTTPSGHSDQLEGFFAVRVGIMGLEQAGPDRHARRREQGRAAASTRTRRRTADIAPGPARDPARPTGNRGRRAGPRAGTPARAGVARRCDARPSGGSGSGDGDCLRSPRPGPVPPFTPHPNDQGRPPC